MIRCLTIILLVCSSCSLFAQPGWGYKVTGNLDDIDSTMLKECIASGSFCHLGVIEITSRTNLNRMEHLKVLKGHVVIDLNLPKLPNRIKGLCLDSIESLTLYTYELNDLSNLPEMPNLKELKIFGFNGEELNITNHYPQLRMLKIGYTDKIYRLGNILENQDLDIINVWDCAHLVIEEKDGVVVYYK